MEEIDLSEPSPCHGNDEKRKAGRERAPSALLFKSTRALLATFALIYIVSFLICFMGSILASLRPYVMSDFSGNSILSVFTMAVRIVSGVFLLPTAKFIDEFGRYRGFVLAASFTVLGLAIQTMATSLTTTIVAQTLQGIAQNCLAYVLLIILADMTSLKNRALVYGIYVTPMLFNSFAAPNIAAQLYSRFGWRWIFGISANVLFVTCVPLAILLLRNQPTRSEVDEMSGYTTTAKQSGRLAHMRRFAVELDLPGIFLLISWLCLLLLPLTHLPWAQDGWPTRTLVAMIVLGVFSMYGFAVWEGELAPTPCVPRPLTRDRNVLGGCFVVMWSAVSAACWGSTYHSYLVVVNDQTSANAGFINNIHLFTFTLSAPLVGYLIRTTGNYKLPAFFAGPFLGAFTGLLLVFNGPDATASALALCQIFLGFSMRLLIACSQMAVMANIDHKDVAPAVGIWGTCLSIGVVLGSGYSEMSWTRAIARVESALPFDSRNVTKEMAESLVTGKPMEYPMGSLVRDAVIAAYRVAQEEVLIEALCFVPVAIGCIFVWSNIDVRKRGDRGNVKEKGVIW